MRIDDIREALSKSLSEMTDPRLVDRLRPFLIPIRKSELIWEWSKEQASYAMWIVAELPERNIGIGYAEGGYGRLGHPWGLVFLDDRYTGPDCSWYATLENCLRDSGYFD